MTRYTILIVDGYGYLPIIERDGKEIYRGEYRQSAFDALEACVHRLAAIDNQGEAA